MARKKSIAAGAINLRLHPHPDEIYTRFFQALKDRHYVTKIRGETHAAITNVELISEHLLLGTFARFSKIDSDSQWFSVERFEPLNDDEQPDINPDLYPNYKPYFFLMDTKRHIFIYEKYGEFGTLSENTPMKFFRNISSNLKFREEFGFLEADHIRDSAALSRLLDFQVLKRITIDIKRPNPDYATEDDEARIASRLEAQRAKREQRTIEAMPGESLQPSNETLIEAEVAISNGEVKTFGKNEDGTSEKRSSEDYPREEKTKYDPDEIPSQTAFMRVARRFLN